MAFQRLSGRTPRHGRQSVPSLLRNPGQRRFAADEQAVSEAVGYILTFGISTVILVTSLQTFTTIQNYTEDISRDRAVDEVAAQIAFAVDQALRAGSFEYTTENHFNMTVTVPRTLAESSYSIVLTDTHVYVNVTAVETAAAAGALGRAKEALATSATADVLCYGRSATIKGGTCSILSTTGEVTVAYGPTEVDGVPTEVWGVFFRSL